MANFAAKRIFNTRERLTSTDLNRSRDLAIRMTSQALASLAIPDVDVSGVITGLLCSVNSVNRTVTVGRGIALVVDDSVTFPDSRYKWIEVQDPITVNIPIGTGFERWDVIEIEPSSLTTISNIVDVWDPTIPPSGSFTPQTVSKETISSPTITVRSGTDNSPSPPFFPTGNAGRIPLAYLRVASGGAVSSGTDGLVRCRPLIRPRGALDQLNAEAKPRDTNSSTWVQGGGVRVTTTDSTSISPLPCQGQFASAAVGFAVPVGAAGNMTTDNLWDGGATGKPGTDAAAYVYAVPPPYIETGYPTLAGREFLPGSDVYTDFATYWHNNLGQENCLIVLSQTPPQDVYVNGGPFGTAEIHDVPFTQGSGTPATSDRAQWAYLGAFDQDGSVAKQQDYKGGGLVIMQQRQPVTDVAAAAVGNGTYDVRVPHTAASPPADSEGRMPATAREVFGVYQMTLNGIAGTFHTMEFDDAETPATGWAKQVAMIAHDTATPTFQLQVRLYLDSSGNVTFTGSPDPQSIGTGTFRPASYIDGALAVR